MKAIAIAAVAALALLAHPGEAPASAKTRGAPFAAAKPLPPGARPAVPATPRAEKPLLTATSTGPGQAGYVHYFIVKLPDETLEIQVGIELPDQRIAWSFPGLGVAVSPFIEEGVVTAKGAVYEVWHLYAIRPFAEDAAMAALAKTLPGRVERWVRAGIPYCLSDAGRGDCMSCLGFVLRALYPGRTDDYPSLPRELARAGSSATGYSTNDLLLYLTGMLELPGREARVRRLSRLTLPDELRDDLEELVFLMSVAQDTAQNRPAARAPKVGNRSTLRRRL